MPRHFINPGSCFCTARPESAPSAGWLQKKLHAYFKLRTQALEALTQVYEQYHTNVGRDAYTEREFDDVKVRRDSLQSAFDAAQESLGDDASLFDSDEEYKAYNA